MATGLNAKYDRWHEHGIAKVTSETKESTERKKVAVADAQNKQIGLQDAIEKKVYPAILAVRTTFGVTGTAFFRHSEWLVSNAHVLPDEASLKEVQLLPMTKEFSIVNSFHRPADQDCPDLIVAKIKIDDNDNFLRHSIENNDSEAKYLYFFAYFDTHMKEYQYKFLETEEPKSVPQKWKVTDGSAGPPGCSGAPIFRAHVNEEMGWIFQLVGVVYARCPKQTSLLYAVQPDHDFNQLLKPLSLLDEATRNERMAEEAGNLGDHDRCKNLKAMASKSLKKANDEQVKYIAGLANRKFKLPESQENLLYSGICPLSDSALLLNIRKKLRLDKRLDKRLDENANKLLTKIPNFNEDELEESVGKLLANLKGESNVELKKKDSWRENDWFRLDVKPVDNGWKIDLQDNFPQRNGGKISVNGQPLSSVFAIAIVPREVSNVNGPPLVEALEKSRDTKKTEFYKVKTPPSSPRKKIKKRMKSRKY